MQITLLESSYWGNFFRIQSDTNGVNDQLLIPGRVNMLILLVFLAIFTAIEVQAKVIIWDLGEVLLRPSKIHAARSHIGIWNSLVFSLENGSNTKDLMSTSLFDVLKRCPEQCNSACIAVDSDGKPLPPVMQDWLR